MPAASRGYSRRARARDRSTTSASGAYTARRAGWLAARRLQRADERDAAAVAQQERRHRERHGAIRRSRELAVAVGVERSRRRARPREDEDLTDGAAADPLDRGRV